MLQIVLVVDDARPATEDEQVTLIGLLDPIASKLGLHVQSRGFVPDVRIRDELAACGVRIY